MRGREHQWTQIDPLLKTHNNRTLIRQFGVAKNTLNDRRRKLGLSISRNAVDGAYNRMESYRIATYPRPAGLGEFLAELREG